MQTDLELKRLLAKMLPEKILFVDEPSCEQLFRLPEDKEKLTADWLNGILVPVSDTELLHLCWMVEETLTEECLAQWYYNNLCELRPFSRWHATWQQRTIALAKTLGVEIV